MDTNEEFFDRPILNSPYEYPARHWKLDESGQPTHQILARRRDVSFITPIPAAKKAKGTQQTLVFDEEAARVATDDQQYELAQSINSVRNAVDRWRVLPDPAQLFHLTKRLLETKWRDPGEEPKLDLFAQLKRVARQWLDSHLVCKGGTYRAQLMYLALADMACERVTRAIVARHVGERPVKAVRDPYNATGSTVHVRFTTSRQTLWPAAETHCHVNWIVCDSDWEAEFCRVAEGHTRVRAYVKNHGLGLEVPYRRGSEARTYIPDFIVLVDDGRGEDDLLHLIVEIKCYRGEDAKDKEATMDTYWVPGVNKLGVFGRWAFAEFTDVYEMEARFDDLIHGFLLADAAD